jgi:hypothetical protein
MRDSLTGAPSSERSRMNLRASWHKFRWKSRERWDKVRDMVGGSSVVMWPCTFFVCENCKKHVNTVGCFQNPEILRCCEHPMHTSKYIADAPRKVSNRIIKEAQWLTISRE